MKNVNDANPNVLCQDAVLDNVVINVFVTFLTASRRRDTIVKRSMDECDKYDNSMIWRLKMKLSAK